MNTPLVSNARYSRRLAWVALCLGLLSLALVVAGQQVGAPVPWTSWALPLLIVASVSVQLFVPAARFPQLTSWYFGTAIIASIAIAVAACLPLLRR